MSNEKVLAALFERIEIGKSYYFEGAYYRLKDYGDHIYGLQRAIPGMCGEKKRHPLALNFTGKMVSWTINSTLILKLAL